MKLRHHLAAAVLTASACVAGAQTPVYRCGPEGREYSQQPCPGGTQFDASDSRSPGQRAQAKQVADAERRHAAALEQERRAREAALVPVRAARSSIRHATPAQDAASKPGPSGRKKKAASPPADTDFIARTPPPPRKHSAP